MANDSNWGDIYNSTWWGDEFSNINSLSRDGAPKGFGYIGDEYPPVVAYSTHRVIGNSVYPSIRTRRSSDNGEQNIDYSINADLDVVGLDAFVNEEVTDNINTTTDSDADGLADGLTKITNNPTATIVTGNGHIGSAQRMEANVGGGTLEGIGTNTLPPIIGQEITISFMYRSNKTFRLGNAYSSGGDEFDDIPANTGDAIRFEAKGVWSPTGGLDGRILPMWLQNAGEFIEISDWSVTHHTADGGVVVFRDQVGTIYNKDTFDFSGGTDGFITTDGTNDFIERLESFQGVNNVVRWYVQTTNGGTHQARNNNGMQEHFRYFVSCKLYLPTNANITKLALYNGSDYFVVVDGATQSNQWVTITDYVFFGAANPRFFIIGLNDDEDLAFSATAGEEFYFADVVIDGDYSLSNTTADEQPLIVDAGTLETDNFIDFDGSNDRLVTKAIDTFQGDFTIDLEVEIPSDTTTRQAIFTNSTSGSDRFGFTLESSRLFFEYYDGATYTGGRVSSIASGTYRITLTRESGVFTIYLNGTSQTIGSLVGWLGSVGNDQMVLGDYRNVTNATSPFFGRVRTCIVYDSALDQAHATRFNEYLQ